MRNSPPDPSFRTPPIRSRTKNGNGVKSLHRQTTAPFVVRTQAIRLIIPGSRMCVFSSPRDCGRGNRGWLRSDWFVCSGGSQLLGVLYRLTYPRCLLQWHISRSVRAAERPLRTGPMPQACLGLVASGCDSQHSQLPEKSPC